MAPSDKVHTPTESHKAANNNTHVDYPTHSVSATNKSMLDSKQISEQSQNTHPEMVLHTEAVAMFTKYAESGRDQIDMQRFVSMMHEVKPGLSESELKLAFELMDSNKDSLIDKDEFCDWFAELKEWGNEND